MITFKILGYGSVVKVFLESAPDFPQARFEVYRRHHGDTVKHADNIVLRDIQDFCVDEAPVFYCCSVNEEELLRSANRILSRIDVAKPNLALLRSFIQKGVFQRGVHFILSNPSDLLAEAIIRETGNKNIYALGLSVDQTRYRKLFPEFGVDPAMQFSLAGNHYDYPLVNFHDHGVKHSAEFLTQLMDVMKARVKQEFVGFKPPFLSGAEGVRDAVAAILQQRELAVAGYSESLDTICGGLLQTESMQFVNPPLHPEAQTLFTHAIAQHKLQYQNLMRECP